jgi:hypothetical protein
MALAQVPAAQAPAERKLQVSFDRQGNVTLVAENVTIPEILGEWARQGGTVMVNAERLPRVPVSRYYLNAPEQHVIESLLRQAAGYIVAPRRAGTVGASRFEIVQILPTSTTSSTYVPPPTSAVSAPVATQGAPDDEIPPVVPPGANRPPAPVNNNPQQQPPGSYPGSPAGVSVPVVPVVPISPVPSNPGRGGAPGPTTPPPGTPPPGGRGGGGGI